MTGEQHAVHYLGLYDTFPRPAEENKNEHPAPVPK